jgi:LmbE family N-acetylglucosaminyl deacetylase
MSLTEKWERFKAEQKDPTLVVTEDAPVIRESQTTEKPTFAPLWAGTSLDVLKLVFDRVEQHTKVINQMTEQMERDGIQYSVRRHLMQARHAEAYAIFKLLGQDNADQNT